MVGHQAEGQYPVAKALRPFLQEQVKAVTVLGIVKYILTGVTAEDYMVQSAGVMYAGFTCHVKRLSSSFNLSSLTLFSFLLIAYTKDQLLAPLCVRHLCKPALKVPDQSVLASKLTTHEEHSIPFLEIND